MYKVILTGILLLSCKSPNNLHESQVALLSATRQQLHTGSKGGGMITNYHIRVSCSADKIVKFDSAWVGKQAFALHQLPLKASRPNTDLESGEILSMEFSSNTMEPIENSQIQAEGHPPVSYKGEALLRYYQDNKPTYLIIPEFMNLEPLYAP